MNRYFQRKVIPGTPVTADQFNQTPVRVQESLTTGEGALIDRTAGIATIRAGVAPPSGQTLYIGEYAAAPPLPTSGMAIYLNTTDNQLWSGNYNDTAWYPMQKWTEESGTPA